jgi:DNA processing protein
VTIELDRLRLVRTEGVGPVAYRRLMQRFSTPEAALDALPRLAVAGGRVGPPAIPSRGDAAREADFVARLGGTLLFLDAPGYPPALAACEGAPAVLTVLGDPACLSARAIAVVGSRNASANGRRLAESISADLAAAGLVVVSGLARGVDAAAHQGALSTGRTIACIAGGIDVVYPREHAALQRAIAEHGAVVAEAPPGAEPLARHFPRRNRVIAGLSLGVLVVEAALRSGSLITARLAGEFGRDVFAVPGSPLDERARGTNALLRDGAHLTETAADVLAALPEARSPRGLFEPRNEPLMPPVSSADGHAAVLTLLSASPTDVDDLVRRCHLPAPEVLSVLLDLEIAGRIETLPGGRVALL